LHIKVKKGGYGRAAVFDRVNSIEKSACIASVFVFENDDFREKRRTMSEK